MLATREGIFRHHPLDGQHRKKRDRNDTGLGVGVLLTVGYCALSYGAASRSGLESVAKMDGRHGFLTSVAGAGFTGSGYGLGHSR